MVRARKHAPNQKQNYIPAHELEGDREMVYHGKMEFRHVLLGLALAFLATSANAMGVVVSGLSDEGDPTTLFTGLVTQSGLNDTTIDIGLSAFGAVDASGSGASSLDTLFMTLTAPVGFLISSISYSESGLHNNTTSGLSIATGSIVLDGSPISLGTHIIGKTRDTGAAGGDVIWTTGALGQPIQNKESIDISIVNSLFAFLGVPGAGASASVVKDTSVLTVGLTAIPLPPAFLLMGTAIVALVAVKRRDAKQ